MAARKKPKQAGTKKRAAAPKKAGKRPVSKKAAARKGPAKKKAPARKGPPPKVPRAPGEVRYFLVKTEPEVFSIDDLFAAPERTTYWDGVRNYQARNTLRDDMKPGDLVLVYHSNAEPPAVAGIAEVARGGYPDHTQFDAKHDHFDPKSKPDNPTWFMVDLRAVAKFPRPVGLPELREAPGLGKMVLLQRGSRLSVQPVTAEEFAIVRRMGGA